MCTKPAWTNRVVECVRFESLFEDADKVIPQFEMGATTTSYYLFKFLLWSQLGSVSALLLSAVGCTRR
jgi:hypothetical protein